MNGMYITFIIYLNGLLSVFICKCDSDTINIYLSKQNVTGSTDDLTGTCNVTGLSRNEVVLTDTCTSSPVLAWIGAYAKYSPWIEYKGCGILKANAIPLQIDFTQKNSSEEPDIFKCFQYCEMGSNVIKYIYIGFQRFKCLCYYINDIEIVQCNNTAITKCGDYQNFICGDQDNVTVIYEIKNLDLISKNDTGECVVVQINDNETTFSSMECSNNAAILCFENGTSKVYPYKTDNWGSAVQYCQTKDGLMSSVENVGNGSFINVTDGTYWVSAIRGVSYTSLQGDNVECPIVNIKHNKTTFGRMACSRKAAVICLHNGTLTAYPSTKKQKHWQASVQFCYIQDGLMSSAENVIKGSILNVIDGIYWVSANRSFSEQYSDNDSCVASFIENGKKMTPIVKSCNVKLPVACRRDSSDPWNGTLRECVTSVQTQSLMERNLIIIIISGSIGFIVLVVVVIILICKRRKRTMKTENVKSKTQETKDLYAEVLPDVEYKNNSGNPQHSNHDRKDSNTHVYNTTQGNDVDDLNPTRKEIHVHTTTQDKDYDDVDPSRMEMHVYITNQAKDYDDLDPSRKETHVYTTTQGKDYDDLDPNRKEMHVYTTTQAKDYDDLDPSRKETHVYTTTQDKDYDDLNPNRKEKHVYNTTQDKYYDNLNPNRKEMHVYNTTQAKDYDDLDPNRKEMHVYNTTQDNTSGYCTTIPADNT